MRYFSILGVLLPLYSRSRSWSRLLNDETKSVLVVVAGDSYRLLIYELTILDGNSFNITFGLQCQVYLPSDDFALYLCQSPVSSWHWSR